jgi:hypothetical protein
MCTIRSLVNRENTSVLFKMCRPTLGPTQSCTLWVLGSPHRVTVTRVWAWPLPPSIAEFKKEWRCTSPAPVCLRAWTGATLHFYAKDCFWSVFRFPVQNLISSNAIKCAALAADTSYPFDSLTVAMGICWSCLWTMASRFGWPWSEDGGSMFSQTVGNTVPASQNRISITTEPLWRHKISKMRQWVFDRHNAEEG